MLCSFMNSPLVPCLICPDAKTQAPRFEHSEESLLRCNRREGDIPPRFAPRNNGERIVSPVLTAKSAQRIPAPRHGSSCSTPHKEIPALRATHRYLPSTTKKFHPSERRSIPPASIFPGDAKAWTLVSPA